MRRDVRLGFGVGGILLAVIIVAVLVVHRNHNKPVAFDTSGKAAGPTDSSGGLDVTAPTDSGKAPEPAAPPAPVKPVDAKGQPDVQDQWAALFASSTSPAKSQLGRHERPQPVSDSPSTASPASEPKADADSTPAEVSAKPERAAPASASGARTHTVRAGETLSSIAKTVYGESRQYKAILAANPGLNPSKMRPGTVIQLPPASSKARESSKQSDAASGGVTAVSDSKTYVVQSGDSLYKITRKLYGAGDNQEKLYEINKQVIGSDSTRLKPGMVLKLPAPPTSQQ